MNFKGRTGSIVIAVIVAIALYVFNGNIPIPGDSSVQQSSLEAAYKAQRSGVWMELEAEVIKLLSDDNKGSRHQRFLIRVPSRHTLLVAHNIDLVERIPLAVGDKLSLRGRYEWNNRGGVIHWVHRDPQQRHEGGWIEHHGKRYR